MKNIKRLISSVLVVVMLMSVIITAMPVMSNAAGSMTLAQLRVKFPHGKYWNHADNPGGSNSVNNQDGYTSTPCSKHGGYIGTAEQTCNGFQPGNTQLSWQCMGYAEKLGYDVTGYNPRNNTNGWYTYTSSSALDNLKPGDIVCYNTHSIYVIGVNGDTVTYTDCNSDGKCIIRWDATISKSTLRSSFSYVRSAPFALDTNENNYADLGTGFTAPILNYATWKIIENRNDIVQTADETGTSNQLWYFERQSDGSYKISSCYDGRCLDVADASSASGAKVQMVVSNDTNAQRWYIYEESGGYVLKAKCTECVLDLPNNDPTNGNQLQMYTKNGTGAQIWAIYRGDECTLKAPTLSVNVGTSATNTTFTWNNVYGESCYDLKIWKDEVWVGDPYHLEWNTYSGIGINLPAGTYQAYVDAANYYECKMSNVVTFTVNEATYANSIALWAFGLKNGEGNNSNNTARLLGTTTLKKTYGEQFTLTKSNCPASIPNGYYLKEAIGSYYNGTVWNSYSFGTTFTQPNKALSFEYDCYPIDYTITYNLNGGSNSSNNPSTYNVLYGVTLEDPTREGYSFAGWTDSNGKCVTGINPGANANHSSAEELYSILSTRTTGNQTFTANWRPDTYTVTYDANGGTNAPAPQTKEHNIDLNLTSEIPERDGYYFVGWSPLSTDAHTDVDYYPDSIYSKMHL